MPREPEKYKNDSSPGESGFGERFYRGRIGTGRFHSFTVSCRDSDLWIGIDEKSFLPGMVRFAREQLVDVRNMLEEYIRKCPVFKSSFIPVDVLEDDPEIVKTMCRAAVLAGTGPMAAVAGAFSEYIGNALQKEFSIQEIVVENGGDIYVNLKQDMFLSVYAGRSPLSGKIGIEIPYHYTPLGICTSAGRVGPSVSFGRADAVMIAARDTALADAYATAFGNEVKTADDIQLVIEKINLKGEIHSALIICEGKLGVCGQFALKPCR